MFEATLKNRSSAHFAPVTITFPIPEDQYEQAILALEKSQIGDARVQDCLIDNVHAPNCPALNRMTGTMANVDELDWLGKQLESFNRYELLQFNAAVERFGLSAADELIDLSFCAREVTVISDFSDLELVGKRHYLTVHGACDPKELENLDGKETALALISGQPGYVTRYGVVYDNGMKLEQAYDRKHLPPIWMAENCSGSMHNLYTLRGAEVRDGAAWASYITEAISLYGKDAEVTFQSHNWPHWGNNVVNDYMVNTAAVYKFINDQTLTYINQGYTSDEISNMIELPEALNKIWYTRQYYGTVAHNAKAVYQKFMGWYDSNPVNLNPLMPSDSAKKWVEYLGDVDKVLQMAKADFDKGEYQWVAEVTNIIVFADPTNTDARLLCADALEQLGYQAESGPWRNEYLTAAQELRHGNANFTASTKSTGDMVKALSAPMLFDYMAIVMDKQALADRDFTMNVILPDVGEQHMLRVKNGVLLVYANTLSDDADVSITCPKNALFAILTNNQETVTQAVKVEGSAELLTLMMENMNQFPITGANPFNIIEP